MPRLAPKAGAATVPARSPLSSYLPRSLTVTQETANGTFSRSASRKSQTCAIRGMFIVIDSSGLIEQSAEPILVSGENGIAISWGLPYCITEVLS